MLKICMRLFTLFLGVAGLSSPNISHASAEKPIVVVIPSYNNKDWYQRNLDSVFMQNYTNFRIIYIDDTSPDGTGELVHNYILEKGKQDLVTLIRNTQRVGALSNLYKGIWMCDPEEIVATLDGDDWLYHENVLARLNNAYADPDVWMTYGKYIHYPGGNVGGEALPREVIANNTYRRSEWVTTHLRTFYAGLFQRINREDLIYDGRFFPMTWDLAMMFPMLEMAGTHSRLMPEVLYVYNYANPINDAKVNFQLQQHLEGVIRNMPKYSPLKGLTNEPDQK